MQRIQPQGELLYNRIAAIYTQVNGQSNLGALDNPLLNLLGVRYVMSTRDHPERRLQAGLRRRGQDLREHAGVPAARSSCPRPWPRPTRPLRWTGCSRSDPARRSSSKGCPRNKSPRRAPARAARRCPLQPPREPGVLRRREPEPSPAGWWSPTTTWTAGRHTCGRLASKVKASTQAATSVEEQLPVYRADGTFRAVYVPKAGQWTVRFVYYPSQPARRRVPDVPGRRHADPAARLVGLGPVL